MADYPVELEREVALRDGARIRIRPIRGEDESRLVAAYDRLSQYTAYQRFFTVMKRLPPTGPTCSPTWTTSGGSPCWPRRARPRTPS
jgi:hypothetical protein